MPDPTNPNTPATTASNPMASAPSWEQFVNQYYRAPQPGMISRRSQGTPTFLNPFGFQGPGLRDLVNRDDLSLGWAGLINAGLMNSYGIRTPEDFVNAYIPGRWAGRAYRNRDFGTEILQQVFRDWQLRQMQQQQQAQPQQQPSEAQAVAPQQQTPAQILSAFSQAASSTPQPLGNYASLLAAMNAVPQQAAQQQVDPLASWIMQYLRE